MCCGMRVKCIHALRPIVNDPECIMGCTEVIYCALSAQVYTIIQEDMWVD